MTARAAAPCSSAAASILRSERLRAKLHLGAARLPMLGVTVHAMVLGHAMALRSRGGKGGPRRALGAPRRLCQSVALLDGWLLLVPRDEVVHDERVKHLC